MGLARTRLTISGIEIELVRKKIKHLHIRVYPPDGEVRVSSPMFMSQSEIHSVIVERLPWINKQRARLQAKPRSVGLKFVTGEVHYLWGAPLELVVVEGAKRSKVKMVGEHIFLYVPFDSDLEKRRRVLGDWYRQQVREQMPALVAKWEQALNVRVGEWRIRRMKTLWGSCNISAKRIWVNLELVQKPICCLDYVVAHEIVHLLERNHGPAFDAKMSQVLPTWRDIHQFLNPSSKGF